MPVSHNNLTLHKIFLAISATILFFSANDAMAATNCCVCTHPQIKNGQFCLKDVDTSCDSLPNSTNIDLKDATCAQDSSANPCKKVPAGKCLNDPTDALSFHLSSVPGYSTAGSSQSEQPSKTLDIKLNIDIPGLTFLAPYKDEDELIVPIFAQYVQAFQKLLIGISFIATAIMIMYGGYLYIISGVGAKVREGKKILTDALIGLVIVLGAVLILSNINPNTASMSALHLSYIDPDYGTTPVAPMYSTEPGIGPKSDVNALIQGAKMAGADACNILAFCEHETGMRQIWNGWPQNTKEDSFMWGACSGYSALLRDGKPFDIQMRKAFPNEWPALGTDLPIPKGQKLSYRQMPIKAELMINNPIMDGYLAGLEAKKATFDTIANLGLGGKYIQRWRIANKCTPQKDLTFNEAIAMGIDNAIMISCLPVAAAGGKEGCPQDGQNCSPVDASKIDTITRGYKMETSATIHGKCASTGKQCYTIFTIAQIRYSIAAYTRMQTTYPACK